MTDKPQPDELSFGPQARHPARWRRWAAVALVAGLAVGGAGAAIAASDPGTPSPTTPSTPDPNAPAERRQLRLGGHGFPGKGWFGALHGEFVVPRSGGGYETVAMQRGEVTGASNTKISVRSEDGFTKTYAVTGDTSVNGGRDGIGSVQRGDQVRVLASVADGRYTAVHVVDVTDARRPFQRWGPRREAPQERTTTPTPS
jgi:hypothetical protein